MTAAALRATSFRSRSRDTRRARSQRSTISNAWRASVSGAKRSRASLAAGTAIEVRELYFNTPARRKFLKSEQTEYAHCEEAFKRAALSCCDTAFSLQHNGRVR